MSDENGGITYTQGMTIVWSDGEKITVNNRGGRKWVEDNVDQIFGLGEWKKIQKVAYVEYDHPPSRNKNNKVQAYECVSGYIPERVINDLKSKPIEGKEEELSKEEQKKAALEALRDI